MLKLGVLLLKIVLSCALNEKLGSYNIDTEAISVSGLSSGGFMAAQVHVIESATFMGVGVIAGGPYNCAKGSLATALGACMSSPALINVNYLIDNAVDQAENSKIDPVENLQNSGVYLFSGIEDTTVKPGVVQAAEVFYNNFVTGGSIKTEYNIDAVHGYPTMDQGTRCTVSNTQTYINDCNYDTAFEILQHIYGGLTRPSYSSGASPAGTLIQFDQTEFFTASQSAISMGDYGYVFIPNTCADGSRVCKLHVSFHGCQQGAELIGDAYVTKTGYNEVAALNNIIILSPQAKPSLILNNPNGCWDFWGYTDSNYAYKNGMQVSTVMNMIKRLTDGSFTSSSTVPHVVTTEDSSSQTTTTKASTVKSTTVSASSGTLGSYKANQEAVSVSGLSAGGFMAIQMHVAASDVIMGVGAVAAGPYFCAMDSLTIATTWCMTMPYMIPMGSLTSEAQVNEGIGMVGDLANLNGDAVYLYSGKDDTVVFSGVVEAAEEFYVNMGVSNIKTEYSVRSQNGFPTVNKGGTCNRKNAEDILNCNFDAAYEILNHIYGGSLLKPDRSSGDGLQGQLHEFEQAEFTDGDPIKDGLSETGMVFIPTSCNSDNSACRVHVAFHGCAQTASIAEAFARDAGYNEVAALNEIIVLYPRSTVTLVNPQGCWDWWGYTNSDYATTFGVQISAVLDMISRLVS